MTDFLAEEDRALLERHGLGTFDALWAKQLEAVDEPNTARGGWSSVFRLELEGQGYYLKRQSNYLTRTCMRRSANPVSPANFATSADIASSAFLRCKRLFSVSAKSTAKSARSC